MRKKFLKSAAAFSIAAACIMGGLVPATVGMPVEVVAAVDPDSADEGTVKTLLGNIISDVIKQEGQVSKDGTAISLEGADTLKLGQAATYTHGEDEIANVTITIENTTCDKLEIAADKASISIKSGETLTADDVTGKTVTIKASVPKTSGTVDETADINLSFEKTVTPPAANTALAKAGISSVEVYGDYATMDIEGLNGTQEILVGIGKVNKNKKTIAVASWATYEGESTTVDLSKLSNVKDNYIVLSTPGNDVSIVKIPASAKSIKAKYDATKGLQVGTAATGSATPSDISDADAAKYEYRTVYSRWQSLQDYETNKKVDLSLYQEEGAKLFIRLSSGYDEIEESSIDTSETWTYGSQKDIAVYKTVSLPGKEAKVAIKAKAKGPKATADYAKGTVKFPRNSEFRLATAERIYKPADTTKDGFDSPTDKVSVERVYELASMPTENRPGEVDIEVRTKATSTKAASKWSRLTIALPAAFAENAITEGTITEPPAANTIEKDKEQECGGDGVAKSILTEEGTTGNALKIEYAGTAKKPTLKITNNSSKERAYEFVKESSGATKVSDSARPVKAAKGKTVTISNIKDGEVIFVRAAGDKTKQEWVGAYAKLGVIDVPKTVVGTGEVSKPPVTETPETRSVKKADLEKFAEDMLITELTMPNTGASTTDVIPLASDETKPVTIGNAGNLFTAEDGKNITGIIVEVTKTGDTAAGMKIFNDDTSSGLKYACATPGTFYTAILSSDETKKPVVTIKVSHADVDDADSVTVPLTLKVAS